MNGQFVVLRVGDDGLVVAAGEGAAGGAISIARLRVGSEKLPARAAAERLGIALGARLADGGTSSSGTKRAHRLAGRVGGPGAPRARTGGR